MPVGRRWPILLCPGPVNVTPAVRRAAAGPDLCHREPEFSALLGGVRRKLLKALGGSATHTVALVSGSGTAALETAVLAAVPPGRKLLIVENGVYGDRLARMAQVHRLGMVHLTFPILERPSLGRVEHALRRDPAIDTVAVVHHETSTGLLNPVREIAALARRFRKSLLVDAISSLGADPLPLAGVDLCVGSAGKCLHGLPGLSFVLVSRRLARRLGRRPARSLYLDLRTLLAAQAADAPPFTPAVPLIQAFDAALDELLAEGLAARIRRYRARAVFLRHGMAQLGFVPLLPADRRSQALTAWRLPPGVTYDTLHDAMRARGFVIYAGQSRLRSQMFRIAHMGAVRQADLRRLLAAMRRFLQAHREVVG